MPLKYEDFIAGEADLGEAALLENTLVSQQRDNMENRLQLFTSLPCLVRICVRNHTEH